MPSLRAIILCLLSATVSYGGACKKDQQHAAIVTEPSHLEHQECAACGMVVREQPAPRGQLIHKDGEHLFFCSVSDMLTYLQAPSPHGPVQKVHVEVLSKDENPQESNVAEHSWVEAKEAHYVLDVEKPLVMGRPILTYRLLKDAEDIAKRYAGRIVPWQELVN